MRLIKLLAVLGVLGFAGLVVYAYFGDMAPVQSDISVPLAIPGTSGAPDGN